MTMRYLKTAIFLLIISVCSFCFQVSFASQADVDAELNNFIEIFKGENFKKQRNAVEPLSWSGIMHADLYDLIEKKLSSRLQENSKVAAEEASWFAKALALSGMPKYKEILFNAKHDAASTKVQKYARTALATLELYTVWNPDIAQGLDKAPPGKLDLARFKNMLSSYDYELVRHGAKGIYLRYWENAEIVAIARERLLQEYKYAGSDLSVDAMAWLIKAIAKSGGEVNKSALEEVINNSVPGKIQVNAKKHLKDL